MTLTIDGPRLIDDLHAFRAIGGVGKGVVRRAFSEADIVARRRLAEAFGQAGLTPVWDPVGNLFGLPPGDEPAILLGSHSDTQPQGGWLDGIYGVVLALEVARAAHAAGGPRVAVVSFQDEEGAFAPLMGSRFWAGKTELPELVDNVDSDGRRLGDMIAQVPELQDAERVRAGRFRCFLEAHIEQGPVLDDTGEAIGVVTSIVGSRNYTLTIEGQQNHAGTTPMDRRKDAVTGLIGLANGLHTAFRDLAGPTTVWTMGRIVVHPNALSIVPGRVEATIQFRDADADRLQRMADALDRLIDDHAARTGMPFSLSARPPLPPTAMASELVDALSRAAEETVPGRWRHMPSGALHDAASVAAHLPVGMLFVPSIGGVSHSFEEDTAEPDLVTGAEVMARAVQILGG